MSENELLRPIDVVVADLKEKGPEMMEIYARKPREFCRDILRMTPQDWQNEFMQAVSNARHGVPNDGNTIKMRFAIKSGTGVGKTAGVAVLILWHTGVFPDSKIPCTAPTSPQIKAVLWPEIRKWVLKIPKKIRPYFPFEVQTDSIKLYENAAYARTAREENPEAFQGFHADNIMLVADEASGVPDAIFLAGQGVMSSKGAVTILIGNPTRPNGWFYDAFHGDSHLYWHRTINCTMSKYVQEQYVSEMARKHGEDSYEFRVRVMGEFHLEDSGFVIPKSWIDDAIKRDIVTETNYVVWGVDVSAGMNDKSAIAKRRGNELMEPVKAWGGKDVMQFVGITVEEYHATPMDDRPQEILVDVIGVGHGYVARLKEELKQEIDAKQVRVVGVNVAERRPRQSRYTSLRVELWAKAREWFEKQTCKFPEEDTETASQLASVEWEINDSNGKWIIVDKRTKGVSPDKADAFVLTFAGRKAMNIMAMQGKTVLQKRFAKQDDNLYAITSASYINN